MKPAPRRWEISDALPLAGQPPILGRILAGRGVDAGGCDAFIGGGAELLDPFGLEGMAEAVITLGVAVTEGRRIAVYGDYDADGVTACAMLTRALRAGGADVLPYIPNRMTEGYGLHSAALEELAARGVQCVVTVDCGTSSVEVAANRPSGMALVVTDHHLPLAPDGSLPRLAPADALINPKQPGDTYGFDGLAGAGVAWKLLCALEAEGIVPAGQAEAMIGLAALGTIADMMPLQGENRTIVRRGLGRVLELVGLRALARAADVSAPLAAADIAFGIAPRINAAGRMEDAKLALDLCLSDSPEECAEMARHLDEQNRSRQAAVAAALEQAEERVAEIPDDAPAIVVGDPGWPMGIVGLVAGKLMERYSVPAFVVCLDPAEAKGSGRSVSGVHIVRALDRAAPTLIRYGGHAAAAGFSLRAEDLEGFRDLVSAACAEQSGDRRRERVFHVDSEIACLDATPELCGQLEMVEPCGIGNPKPLLAIRDCEVVSTHSFGSEGQHLRVSLRDGGRGLVEAIAFGKPGLAGHLPRGRRIDVCFALELDSWQGQVRVRARLRDLRPARVDRPESVTEALGVPA
ncbi:MAG: single-stranded-DNA-specific exonuclease RecJ [Candidatus Dormibacteria bacterium]|jgi:single-stranded-DNA-specific exonuclease